VGGTTSPGPAAPDHPWRREVATPRRRKAGGASDNAGPGNRARDDRQHSGRPERGAGPELAATVVLAVWRRRPVDPDAGKFTFKEYAEHWRTLQVHRGNTEDQVDVVLEIRTYPRLGHLPLAPIDSEDIQSTSTICVTTTRARASATARPSRRLRHDWATRTLVRPWTPTGITTAFRPGDHGATANVISPLEASD